MLSPAALKDPCASTSQLYTGPQKRIQVISRGKNYQVWMNLSDEIHVGKWDGTTFLTDQ